MLLLSTQNHNNYSLFDKATRQQKYSKANNFLALKSIFHQHFCSLNILYSLTAAEARLKWINATK